MKNVLNAVCLALGMLILWTTDILGTKTGQLIFRLTLSAGLIYTGVTLARHDSISRDVYTNSASFWETAGIGFVLVFMGLLILTNTLVRPLGRELARKGYYLGSK